MGKIDIKDMDLFYGSFQALKNVNLEIEPNKITAFIGPSGCGKSTLLKSLNRMNDLVEGCRIDGKFFWMDRIFTQNQWMSTHFGSVSEWYSRNRTRSR